MSLVYTAAAALVLSWAAGSILIPVLRRFGFGQRVRDQGPQRHKAKTGTPTMGGIIFVIGILIASLLFVEWTLNLIVPLACMIGFGVIGFMDDYLKVVLRRSLGLRARYKLAGQVAIGLFLSWMALVPLGLDDTVQIPFSHQSVSLGSLYVPFVVLILIGSSNAINITDGLDGLAAGLSVIAFSVYGIVSLLLDKMEVAAFSFAVAAACLGFLRHNLHPARVFMGDTGSLALGGALGCVAVLTKTELLLPIIAGVFVIETLSVVVQVISFHTVGRRLFRMSPLHHHFELAGWSEQAVVSGFWVLGGLLGLLGLFGFIRAGGM